MSLLISFGAESSYGDLQLPLRTAMASLLSLPRPPSCSSAASHTGACASTRSASSSSVSNLRHPFWCSVATEFPISLSRSSVVGPESAAASSRSSRILVGCNVVPELQSHGSRSSIRSTAVSQEEEDDECTTSGSSDGECGSVAEAGTGAFESEAASLGRREAFASAVAVGVFWSGGAALARDRRNRKEVAAEDYLTSAGVKYYDVEQGKGAVAEKGETVLVHFDCVYRSITAVSSRESKILSGNRTIAQPYEFIVGAEAGKERKREFVDNANGLFSAQAAPKPPPALYAITEGMRVGGKRTVIVPPEVGYGKKGLNEIPPNATFDMNVELLEVKKPQNDSSSK